MERLTVNDLDKVCYDPWELCGMDCYCTKSCHELGGCAKGCQIPKMYRKLAEYENLEEQRKLMKLPCAVGDTVYRMNPVSEAPVIEMIVTKIEIRKDGELVIYTQNTVDGGELFYKYQESLDRTILFTREEVEQALSAERKRYDDNAL